MRGQRGSWRWGRWERDGWREEEVGRERRGEGMCGTGPYVLKFKFFLFIFFFLLSNS